MIRFRSIMVPILLTSATVVGPVATPAAAQFALDIRVNFAPPALPVYLQPPVPGPDFIWTPGYWAWDPGVGDYYWVPGTWVRAPRPGYLWTPAWWGWDSGDYVFHRGYWGERVGFYGGVDYGFGYTGFGFFGGRWDGDHFAYNRTVNNITNVNITNVYEERVNVDRRVTNISYSGGPGGIQAQPTTEQRAAERQTRFDPTPDQQRHIAAAQGNRALFAGANHGVPSVAATARPAVFRGPDVARAAPPGAPPPPLARNARAEGAFASPTAPRPAGDPRAVADPYHPDRASPPTRNGGPPPGYGGRPAAGYGNERPPPRYSSRPPVGYGNDRPPPAYNGRPPAGYGNDRPPPGYGSRPPEASGAPPPPLRAQQPTAAPRPPQPHPEPRPAPHPDARREHPEGDRR